MKAGNQSPTNSPTIKEVIVFESFRRWQRFSISTKALIKRRDEGSPKGLIGHVTTISQGGMGFYTEILLEKDTPVSVELLFQALDGTRQDAMDGKIASVCKNGEDYFLGIAFDKEIPHDQFFGIIN